MAHVSFLSGIVVPGDRRGRQLGFPTANLDSRVPADVPFGIYAARALGRPAAASIGVRPTYGNGLEPRAEVFILDFDGDLYGQRLDVELVEFLRGELRFDGQAALIEQIRRDVAAVRQLARVWPPEAAAA
jgi:riboflavin kinase/FMN adenylyltransferase